MANLGLRSCDKCEVLRPALAVDPSNCGRAACSTTASCRTRSRTSRRVASRRRCRQVCCKPQPGFPPRAAKTPPSQPRPGPADFTRKCGGTRSGSLSGYTNKVIGISGIDSLGGPRRRSRKDPRPICPGVGSRAATWRCAAGREYLYAVHESRAGAPRAIPCAHEALASQQSPPPHLLPF